MCQSSCFIVTSVDDIHAMFEQLDLQGGTLVKIQSKI